MAAGSKGSGFALAFALSACCSHPVRGFDATPALICAKDPVTVVWDVDGEASLTATPQPADWVSETPSKGERTVHPTVDTDFALTSVQANPAKEGAPQHRFVKVKQPGKPDQRGTTGTPCDEARHCKRTFKLQPGSSAVVASVSKPLVVRSGHDLPARKMCVTPPGGTPHCFEGDQIAEVNAPVAGDWTLEVDLLDGEETTPPLTLKADFTFACK